MNKRILTQKEMSELANVDRPLMCKYLKNVKTPTLTTATRIARDCNVPIEIFLKKKVQIEFLGKSFLAEDVDVDYRPNKIIGRKCEK